jgi:hypothetical protein
MTAPLHRSVALGLPHQWRSREITTLSTWCAETMQATALELPEILARILDWSPSGMPSGGDTKVAGGGRNDDGTKRSPAADAAIRNLDDHSGDLLTSMHSIIASLVHIAQVLEQVEKNRRDLRVMDPKRANEILEPIGAGYCINPECNRYVPGGKDRRRAERCEPCYRYWLDGSKNRERPKELCWPALTEDVA